MTENVLLYVSENLASIFTGLTMMLIGITVYKVGDGWFLAGGQFRGKYEALIIVLACLAASSMTTPIINSFWESVLPQLLPAQILGGLLVIGMVTVNSITNWNYFDLKSIPVYVFGAALVYEPTLLSFIPI